jgi:general secretion pathway protein N
MLGIAAVALALLLIAIWLGLGRGAHWQDRAESPKLPPLGASLPAPTVPPLEQYGEVWQHPLFSPTRTPEAATAGGGGASSDLQLTGVILLPGLKMAILHDKTNGRDYRVVEGQPSKGGPALLELHPRSAVVEASGAHLQLQLIPGPSPDAGNATANPSSNPGAGENPERVESAGNGASGMVSHPGRQDSGRAANVARARALKARIEARRRKAQKNGGG